MKTLILIAAVFLFTLNGFSQSKRELNNKINESSLKVESLSSKIDVLTEQNKSQEKEIDRMSSKIDDLVSELKRINTQAAANAQISPNTPPVKEAAKTIINGQCKAITSVGNQCSRTPQNGSDYCWQHAKKNKSDKVSKSSTDPGSTKSTYNGSREIQTGPRGGQYYINSKGNKTYIKK